MVYRSYASPKKGTTTYVPSQRPSGQFREFEGKRKVTKTSTGELIIEGEKLPAGARKKEEMTVEKATVNVQTQAQMNEKEGVVLSPAVRKLVMEDRTAEKALAARLPSTTPELQYGVSDPIEYAEREKIPYYREVQTGYEPKPPGRLVEQSQFLGFDEKQAAGAFEVRRRQKKEIIGPILIPSEVKLPAFLAQQRSELRREAFGLVSVQRKFTTTERIPGKERGFIAGSRLQPVERIYADDNVYVREFKSLGGEIVEEYGLRKAFLTPEQAYKEELRYKAIEGKDVVIPKRIMDEIRESQFNVGFVAGAGLGAYEGALRTGAFKKTGVVREPVKAGMDISYDIIPKEGKIRAYRGKGFDREFLYERVERTPKFQEQLRRILNERSKVSLADVLKAEGMYRDPLKAKSTFKKLVESKKAELGRSVIVEEQKPGYDFDVWGQGEYFEVRTGAKPRISTRAGSGVDVIPAVGVGSLVDTSVDQSLLSKQVTQPVQLVHPDLRADASVDFDVVTDVGLRTEQRTDIDRLFDIISPPQSVQSNVFQPVAETGFDFDFPKGPPSVPIVGLPNLSFGGGYGKVDRRLKKQVNKSFDYQPQFGAVFFGIKGRPQKDIFTGLEFRGL